MASGVGEKVRLARSNPASFNLCSLVAMRQTSHSGPSPVNSVFFSGPLGGEISPLKF